MPTKDKNNHFKALREKFSFFVYEGFDYSLHGEILTINFNFNLADTYFFNPQITIPTKTFFSKVSDTEALENLIFHLGMIEIISYWKAACPKHLIIRPALLSPAQIIWWKKLYFLGLGEMFYLNSIHTTMEEFMEISCESQKTFEPFSFSGNPDILVPVGGGKDSVVTLELLKNSKKQITPFMLNPNEARLRTVLAAGFDRSEVFEIHRSIDPKLLQLNKEGFLNGHTPFSAVLAFSTLLAAQLSKSGWIALSNEASANEATIPGTKINHQYSKSYEFENDFRTYYQSFLTPGIGYFSFLRPLNELQIARIFSNFPQHFHTFRSCNVGSKTDQWCGNCPKCLFTYIILSPFIEKEKLDQIFDKDLLQDPNLEKYFTELSGIADEKPFECVGTIAEVNASIVHMIQNNHGQMLPLLIEKHKEVWKTDIDPMDAFLQHFNETHFLNPEFETLLRQKLL